MKTGPTLPPANATVWHCALTALADWPSPLAVGVLLLNDHVLKAAVPAWWTGKLSDFAGLVFFPFLVLAGLGALEWLGGRRFRSPDAAMRLALALSALWFASLKLSPWTQRPALALLERLTGAPRVVVADPTDLIALAMLPAVWARWRALRRREALAAEEPARAHRRFWQTLALATAALAALATSPSPTPVDFGMVAGVAADAGNPDIFYAEVATQQILGCKKLRGLGAGNYCEPTAVDRRIETYRTQDGGRTWELYSNVGGYLWADPYTPERIFVLNENGLHRLDGGTGLRLNVPVSATIMAPFVTAPSIHDNPYALAFDPLTPGTLYLAKNDHFYISRDAGETWLDNPVVLDSKPTQIYRLAITPTEPRRVYAAVSYGGILRSDDLGQSWRVAGTPNWSGETVMALVIHPQNPDLIYVALSSRILFSADGGQTWNAVQGSYSRLQGLAIHPTNPDVIYAADYYNDNRVGKIIGSDDSGMTWKVLNEQSGFGLAISPISPYRLMLGWSTKGVNVQDTLPAPTTLNSVTETVTSRLIYADAFAIAPKPPGTLYTLVSASRLWGASNDGGQNWITQTLPNHVGEIPERLVAGGQNAAGREMVVAADRGMLYRFYPQAQGVAVDAQALPPDLRDLREGAGARPLVYLSGARRWLMAGPAGVVYSDDDAQTWTAAVLSDSLVIAPGIVTGTLSWPAALAASPQGSPAYAAVAVDHALEPTQVLLRSDDGVSWSIRAWLTQTQMTALAAHPSNPDMVYGSNDAGVYRSGDGGVTWQKCYTHTAQGTTATRILALSGSQAWATTAAGIIRSDDNGATWTVTYPIPQLYGPRVFLDAALAPDRSAILLLARPTLPDTPMPSLALPPVQMRYNLEEGWQTFNQGLPVHFKYHYAE